MRILQFLFFFSFSFAHGNLLDLENHYVSYKELQIGSATFSYKITTGFIHVKNNKEEVIGDVFFTSYNREDENQAKRPITFVFNGGPGSSSVWLHLGAFGPKMIPKDNPFELSLPPFEWETNQATLLDISDLVFIDPLGTGFSRVHEGADPSPYYCVEGDIKSIGSVIQNYLTIYQRWASPKYIIGESYGGLRAIGVTEHLQDRYGVYFNGVVLISPAIELMNLEDFSASDLPYILYLPTLSEIAVFHGKVSNLAPNIAKDFAEDQYAKALFQGDNLSDEEYDEIVEKLSDLTSLSVDVIKRHNLRIGVDTFRTELLKDEQRVIGGLDGRFSGFYSEISSAFDHSEDPSMNAIDGLFTAVFNQYLLDELGCKDQENLYEMLNYQVNSRWNYLDNPSYMINMGRYLKRCLVINPKLKVFIAGGKHDLRTPLGSVEYTVNHLGLPKPVRNQITSNVYSGGHMFYIQQDQMSDFKQDLAKWYSTHK